MPASGSSSTYCPGSSNCGGVKFSSVGGSRSPRGTPGSSGGTSIAKFPPLLSGGPAAGCGSESINSAARFEAGTSTSPIISCGTKTAPLGITICDPSGKVITRSRPTTRISDSSTPGGRVTMPGILDNAAVAASGGIWMPSSIVKVLEDCCPATSAKL